MNFAAYSELMGGESQPKNLFDQLLSSGLAKDTMSTSERIASLGIPKGEMSDSVRFALSALIEKLDDVTIALEDAHQQLDEMETLVDVDTLTPIPNRRAFMRRLDWAISMLARYGHKSSVVFFDLNGFKHINDTHGHAAGDAAIQHVAEVLDSSKRDSDFLARMGGDEFAIIMFHADETSATRRANNIAEKLRATPCMFDGLTLNIDTSVGCHEITSGENAERALAAADKKMFAHKKANKISA